MSKVIWQKAAWPSGHPSRRRMPQSVERAEQAHSPTAAGEQRARHSCVGTLQWAGPYPLKSAPSCALDPRKSTSQTASRSVQPFFCTAHSLTQPNTHRHTDHATCDICCNRPRICTARNRRCLTIIIMQTF